KFCGIPSLNDCPYECVDLENQNETTSLKYECKCLEPLYVDKDNTKPGTNCVLKDTGATCGCKSSDEGRKIKPYCADETYTKCKCPKGFDWISEKGKPTVGTCEPNMDSVKKWCPNGVLDKDNTTHEYACNCTGPFEVDNHGLCKI